MMERRSVQTARLLLMGYGLYLLGPTMASAAPLSPWPQPDFARGMVYSSWDGSYPHEEAWRAHLKQFKSMGINWLEIMTFAHQPRVNGPQINLSSANDHCRRKTHGSKHGA